MLSSIHIENIAVIKSIDLDFSKGFNVMTGQTGAGKSIIIDSLNLVLGARADKELIRSGENKAFVSAVFTVDDEVNDILRELKIPTSDEVMAFREIGIDGKSVSKINGRTVSASVLRQVISKLVTILGQHDSQDLLRPETHIDYVDSYANCYDILTQYKIAYDEYCRAKATLESHVIDDKEKARKKELLEYQINDINNAKLKPGEEEKLKETKVKLKNYEKINKSSSTVYKALYENEKGVSAYSLIDRAILAITSISEVLGDNDETVEKLEECKSLICDIAHQIDSLSIEISADPEELLTKIENRLAQIDKLRMKYGADIGEILSYRDALVSELDTLENSEQHLSSLRQTCNDCLDKVLSLGAKLTAQRKEASTLLERKICEQLSYLDMNRVRFCVKFTPLDEPCSNGVDNVEFLISANAGEELHPLAKVASGGELSRVMLALKCVFSETDGASLMVFDEIDTGISGKTSVKVGKKLRELSENYQVMCITHSAQIAALAESHMLISKKESAGRVYCQVDNLDYEGRVTEISRIIGGEVITEATTKTAKELLAAR